MTRLPRFERSDKIAPIQLTGRDHEILSHVHRHRFLRSNHIAALTTGSRQQTLRRLQKLFHHGYLDRPLCQIDYYQRGSRRMAYGLGNKGAALLKTDWRSKNQIGRLFLDHALMVSDIMVALELACRKRSDVKLLTSDVTNWRVNLNPRVSCGVVPDKVFGLEQNGKQCWYFLEADRATMPVVRDGLDQTSIRRKLLAYAATWTQKIHTNELNIQRFRVLTVTTDAARVRQMIAACPAQGRGLFLFTDIAALLAQPDFFALPWQTPHGATASLLE